MNMNPLVKLQEWWSHHCDGDWEHGHSIRITTLDNPGWSLDVSLKETELETVQLERVTFERSENDWLWCWTEAGVFHARGGIENLDEMIRYFLQWSGGSIDKSGERANSVS